MFGSRLLQSVKRLAVLNACIFSVSVTGAQDQPQLAIQEPQVVALEQAAVAIVAQDVVASDQAQEAAEPAVDVQNVQAAFMVDGADQHRKLQAVIRVENALAQRACKLTAAQEQQLGEINDKWLLENAVVRQQANNLAVGVIRLFAAPRVVGQQPANSAKMLVDRVRKAQRKKFAEFLTPEQLSVYEHEVTLRDAFRRSADAECIVALLDERLMLSAHQRTALTAALNACDEIDDMYTPFYFQNDNYVPSLPLSLLKEHLSKEQLKLFQSMQTVMVQRSQFNDGQEQVVIGLR